MTNNIHFYKSYRHIFEMYIAFRWLLGLTLAMWVAVCCIDNIGQMRMLQQGKDSNIHSFMNTRSRYTLMPIISKLNDNSERLKNINDKQSSIVFVYLLMFLAGGAVVSLYNRLDLIISVAKHKFIHVVIITKQIIILLWNSVDIRKVQSYCFAISKAAVCIFLKIITNITIVQKNLMTVIRAVKLKIFKKQRINLTLLKKIKEIGEERKNLAQLFMAAIRENKNIRMQYQLENMAKKRLARYIETTQKLIKENRFKYVSFQQLYLVTHQENTFLKSRLQTLIKDKEEAEKNLTELLNEVYKSKNSELKAFCSRFIVKTQKNFFNSDVRSEIQSCFLKPYSETFETSETSSNVNWRLTDRSDGDITASKSSNSSTSVVISDQLTNNNSLEPLISEAPKLKGLPGEYVWTVKDKNGLIEKLYEYEYNSDLDNGETIRRIRQYTVYHDRDCFLDFTGSSSTIITKTGSSHSTLRIPLVTKVDAASSSSRFLTQSKEFQSFMRNNKNVVSRSIVATQSMPTARFFTHT